MSTEVNTYNESNESLVIYEVGYLFLPTIAEEKLEETVGKLKALIAAKKGTVIDEGAPKMQALAYTMDKVIETKRQKFDHAYFGWVKFEVDGSEINSIKKNIEALDEVLRALFIKTVRESTLMAGKVSARDAAKAENEAAEAAADVVAEVKPEANEEEIDKSIDALVMN